MEKTRFLHIVSDLSFLSQTRTTGIHYRACSVSDDRVGEVWDHDSAMFPTLKVEISTKGSRIVPTSPFYLHVIARQWGPNFGRLWLRKKRLLPSTCPVGPEGEEIVQKKSFKVPRKASVRSNWIWNLRATVQLCYQTYVMGAYHQSIGVEDSTGPPKQHTLSQSK